MGGRRTEEQEKEDERLPEQHHDSLRKRLEIIVSMDRCIPI